MSFANVTDPLPFFFVFFQNKRVLLSFRFDAMSSYIDKTKDRPGFPYKTLPDPQTWSLFGLFVQHSGVIGRNASYIYRIETSWTREYFLMDSKAGPRSRSTLYIYIYIYSECRISSRHVLSIVVCFTCYGLDLKMRFRLQEREWFSFKS